MTDCPRARSAMTPCVVRDGEDARADDGVCVGCGWSGSGASEVAIEQVKRPTATDPNAVDPTMEQFEQGLAQLIVSAVAANAAGYQDAPESAEFAAAVSQLRALFAEQRAKADEAVDQEAVEGVVREGQVRGSMWILEPVVAIDVNCHQWPIGTPVTVTRRVSRIEEEK